LALLLAGADPKPTDKHGDTPYKLAKDNDNECFVSTFLKYVDARKGVSDFTPFKATLEKMKYQFVVQAMPAGQTANTVTSMSSHDSVLSTLRKAKKNNPALTPLQTAGFPVPEYLENTPPRIAEKPFELAVHEHNIAPLTSTGFNDLQGVDSLRCLSFATSQALLNAERRERLVRAANPNLEHVPITG
jgi:hypothetical protein